MTAPNSPAARRGEDARRRGLITARDLLGSIDAAARTAGAIGLLLTVYVVLHGAWIAACDLNNFLYDLGALLAAAANGAS